MSKWKGISHGRMTRAMEQSLSPAEFKVLAVVRRIIPDGQRRMISQFEIARRARVSESTVSATMRKVDGIFTRRFLIGIGRGRGYEIEMIPPAEQLRMPLSSPRKGSLTDPSSETSVEGIETAQTASKEGSLTDPAIFYDHNHEQQQQAAAQTGAERNAGQADQLAPETIAALEKAGAHPKLIARIAANNPNCSPAQVAEALLAAEQKSNCHTLPGLALECLARAQRVVVPRARAESRSDMLAPIDWAARNRAAEGDMPDDAEDDLPPPRDPHAEAILLLGECPPSHAEQIFLAQRIFAGDSPEAAADALRTERSRRPRPEDRVVPTMRRRQGRSND